jgi:transcriptional regulator with XRE-family HTH domain
MPKTIYSAEQELLQDLLRKTRTESGLTQIGLAVKLKRPQSFVSKYESGERRLDLVELRQVCLALGITLSRFAERFEKMLRD